MIAEEKLQCEECEDTTCTTMKEESDICCVCIYNHETENMCSNCYDYYISTQERRLNNEYRESLGY